jgi:hypothetical protein
MESLHCCQFMSGMQQVLFPTAAFAQRVAVAWQVLLPYTVHLQCHNHVRKCGGGIRVTICPDLS